MKSPTMYILPYFHILFLRERKKNVTLVWKVLQQGHRTYTNELFKLNKQSIGVGVHVISSTHMPDLALVPLSHH
jgi:predicted ferric reductase